MAPGNKRNMKNIRTNLAISRRVAYTYNERFNMVFGDAIGQTSSSCVVTLRWTIAVLCIVRSVRQVSSSVKPHLQWLLLLLLDICSRRHSHQR